MLKIGSLMLDFLVLLSNRPGGDYERQNNDFWTIDYDFVKISLKTLLLKKV